MLSGWQEIDGHSYYFAMAADVPKQTWFWKILGDTGFGKRVYEYLGYRIFGSMYVNEQTPDGQKVNEAGMKEQGVMGEGRKIRRFAATVILMAVTAASVGNRQSYRRHR